MKKPKNYSLFNKMMQTLEIKKENNESKGFKRVFGVFQLSMIGISSTIGAGIYVLTGTVASDIAGPAVILSYLIAGFASLLSALCYCELSSIYPNSGSAYSYIYITMGEFLAFLVGWNMILEYIVGSAAIVRSFSDYMSQINNQTFNIKFPQIIIQNSFYNYHVFDYWSLFICLFVTILLLIYGIKKYTYINMFGTIINLISIAFICFIGFFYINNQNWKIFAPYGIKGIISGASICFFSYVGFDVVASLGNEAINPTKSIPLSIFCTIIICGLLYILVSAILTLIAPYNLLKGDAAFIKAFLINQNSFATWIISIGAMFGLMACVFASLLPAPRILFTMASDGLLFMFLNHVSEKTGIPVVSTIICGVFSGLLSFLLTTVELVEMMSIGTLFAYTAVCISVVVLRVKSNFVISSARHSSKLYKNTVYLILIFNVFSSFIISIVLIYFCHVFNFDFKNFQFQKHILVILFLTLVILFVIIQTMLFKLLQLFIQSENINTFNVPLVPFIPMLGMSINIFLMVSLQYVTWIRFFTWVVIGIIFEMN